MTDPLPFALAALILLAAPGPTTVLLAASGAAAGFIRSLPLLVAAVAGYVFTIAMLGLVIMPIAPAAPLVDVGLRVACALYLFYAAWMLWREASAASAGDSAVGFRRVLIATALNPKGVVLALAVVPFSPEGSFETAAPYLAALIVLIAIVGVIWIAMGSAARANSGMNVALARRASAFLLFVFGVLISGSALNL